MVHVAFDAIGTQWRIETGVALSPALRRKVDDRIAAFEAVWSRFRADTLVTTIAKAWAGGTFRFPDEASDLFALYDTLHRLTNGAVDPLVGRDLELLGYDAAYSLTPVASAHGESRSNWSRDVRREGTTLVSHRPVVIDVGAAGKGLLIDIVAQLLIDDGIQACGVVSEGAAYAMRLWLQLTHWKALWRAERPGRRRRVGN